MIPGMIKNKTKQNKRWEDKRETPLRVVEGNLSTVSLYMLAVPWSDQRLREGITKGLSAVEEMRTANCATQHKIQRGVQ